MWGFGNPSIVRSPQPVRQSIRPYILASTPPGPRLSPRFGWLPAMTSAARPAGGCRARHVHGRHPNRVQGRGEEVSAGRHRAGLGLSSRPQELPRPEPRRGDLPAPLCHRRPEERPPLEAAPRRRRLPAVLLQCRWPRHRDRPGVSARGRSRKPGSYERIYDYLTGIGVAEI